jgi:vacuolar-type H+-ATPase subunit I/STV1
MSTCDTTLAFAVPYDRLPAGANLSSFTKLYDENNQHAVHTTSSNDGKLESICAESVHGGDLYLLRDFAVLSGAEITRAAAQIKNLLSDIEDNPQIVRVATRFRHLATKDATSTIEDWVRYYSSFEAQSDATVENGWVYTYSVDDVRSILRKASAKDDPCPAWDEDGRSLEYVFGLLKSHLSLLLTAEKLNLVVVYGKPSEALA